MLIVCFLPTLAPRATGFFGREAPKYSDLKMTEVFFSLPLVNNPAVSGFGFEGLLYFVSLPPTRVTFLKLLCLKIDFFTSSMLKTSILVWTPQIMHLYFITMSNCDRHF